MVFDWPCRYYVVVAWIWAIIWYVALDPIKWGMAWILDEEGYRTGKGSLRAAPSSKADEGAGLNHVGPSTRHNPMGRVSIGPPTSLQLERASIVRVSGPFPQEKGQTMA